MATTQKPRSTTRRPTQSRTRTTAKNGRQASAQAAPAPAPRQAAKSGSDLRTPLIAAGTAVAGIVGGIALGAKALPRRRSRSPLGLDLRKLDLGKVDMKKAAKQAGRAGKQFGALTRELRKAGEQAERIGDALS